jgi:hypothetical protein
MYMAIVATKEKTVKDLTVSELKQLIQESIAEDIEAWRATFEIISNKTLMGQIRGASKARSEGRESDFIPWEKVKREV